MTTLYQAFVDAGCETDHHESDLYVRDTSEARIVLKQWQAKHDLASSSEMGAPFVDNIKGFRSQIDGRHWLDIPFAYAPFWEGKH